MLVVALGVQVPSSIGFREVKQEMNIVPDRGIAKLRDTGIGLGLGVALKS